MTYPKVCLRRGEETGVRAGKPWIFENQLDWADDVCKDGGIVDVLDSRMRFAARGYFNSKSKITVRVLTRDENEVIDRDFFRRRIERAWSVRRMLGFENSCRVVFGESDGLPGLTVDKFADCLSFQIVSRGMERWKDDIVAILAELFQPQGIYERDDVAVREKEGLPQIKECVYGTVPEEIEIREHDARMLVSIENGQKTGHFLDQQENRGRLKPYAKGRSVLDLCCCTGGFSIHAALYGAKSVEAVDVSADALAMAKRNADRNGLTGAMSFREANVFELLTAMGEAKNREYDYIILDPPAFTKSHGTVHSAERGYHEINRRAMQLLPRGGYLATCSCSHFMTEELFCRMLQHAAADAGRSLRQIEARQQSPDHPILWNVPETNYLKFYLFQVV